MNELHQQQTENQALIFRVNHLQIQNDALFNSDQKHKLNLDQALFVIATLEQDKLLLEVRYFLRCPSPPPFVDALFHANLDLCSLLLDETSGYCRI